MATGPVTGREKFKRQASLLKGIAIGLDTNEETSGVSRHIHVFVDVAESVLADLDRAVAEVQRLNAMIAASIKGE